MQKVLQIVVFGKPKFRELKSSEILQFCMYCKYLSYKVVKEITQKIILFTVV